MFREIALAVVQDAVLLVCTDAQIPERVVDHGRADQRAANRAHLELRTNGAIHFGQGDRFRHRHNLTQFPRHVPAHAEVAKKGVDRIE